MKKTLLVFAFAILGFSTAFGQYYHLAGLPGNPGTANAIDSEYPVGGGLPSSWTTILNAGLSVGMYSPSQNLPFAFDFNGSPVTSYRVSNTGILTFGNSMNFNPGAAPVSLNDSNIPDSSICVLGLTSIGTNDNVVSQTFGTAPNRQHWVFFTSYSASGTTASHWTYWSIVLEESTNNIYIVDQRSYQVSTAFTIGVKVDGSNYDEIANLSSTSANAADASDNTHFTFIQGIQPDYEIAALNTNIPPYLALTAAPFNIEATFINNGAQTLTSADINYSVNGGTPVSSTQSGLSISNGTSGNITSSSTWNPMAAGTYNIKIWLENINGSNVDANTGNDTVSVDVQVVPAMTERFPLYETFTSSTCGPCVNANTNMEAIFAANPGQANSIKYQMSWPGSGDPYYYAEGGARRTFYGINSVPRVEIDGGWDDNGNSLTQSIYDGFKNVPAFVDMSATWSRWSKSIETTVNIDPLADISGNLRLFAAIYSIRDTANVGSNGETEFFHVVKKLMPDESGLALADLKADSIVSHTLSYTFNGTYILPPNATSPVNLATNHTVENFENLGVILWIQDMTTKEVHQSVNATYVLGQEENSFSNLWKVYPNPTTDVLRIEGNIDEMAEIKLVDMSGRMVLQSRHNFGLMANTTMDVSTLTTGTYLLITTSTSGVHAQPVIIR